MKKYAALYVRRDSGYKKRAAWDCFDADRDAATFNQLLPVAAHPPCRAWGALKHLSFRSLPESAREPAREQERMLAISAIKVVRECGGILEHPAKSLIFRGGFGSDLPDAGEVDAFGGFTVLIDQFNFGHVAHKLTKLYVCGIDKQLLPDMPPQRTDSADRSICGNVPGTKRCTQYQREYTPEKLIDWIESVLELIKQQKQGASKMSRRDELLKAAHDLLKKQTETPYVLDILEETVFYDGTDCDGLCLMEDIALELAID